MTMDLPDLEHGLWRAETRFDRALMEATFAPDFFEFGRSGRRYTREDLLPDPTPGPSIDARLHEMAIKPLSETIALVTYLSEVRRPEGTEWGNRASIWDKSSGHWQLRFHQGTPTSPKERP